MLVYKKGRAFYIEKSSAFFVVVVVVASQTCSFLVQKLWFPVLKYSYCIACVKRVNPQPLYYIQIQSTRINTTFLFLIVSLQNWSILCNCDSCKYHVGSNFDITNTALTQCLVFISPFRQRRKKKKRKKKKEKRKEERKKDMSTHPYSWYTALEKTRTHTHTATRILAHAHAPHAHTDAHEPLAADPGPKQQARAPWSACSAACSHKALCSKGFLCRINIVKDVALFPLYLIPLPRPKSGSVRLLPHLKIKCPLYVFIPHYLSASNYPSPSVIHMRHSFPPPHHQKIVVIH